MVDVASYAGRRGGCTVTLPGSGARRKCVGLPGHGKVCRLPSAATVGSIPRISGRRASGSASRHFTRRGGQPRGRSRVNALVSVLHLTRAAAEARMRRERWSRGRATSWRTAQAGRGCVGVRWCARQTGGGQPVKVRRKEGVTDHLHPESCVGRCEAAGEALTGARTDGAIEHRKQRVLERRDCHRGRRPHRHSRDG